MSDFRREDSTENDELRARLERLEAQTSGNAGGRWWRRAAIGMIAVALSLPLAADALGPVPNIFATGGTISATEMNENFSYLQNAITAVEGQVPTGTVAMFDLTTCPTGWSEVPEARGRALVGMPGSAGTLLGTVGAALTDVENRSHTHSTDLPLLTTTSSSVPHTHSDGSLVTSSDSHNHRWYNNYTSFNSGAATVPTPGFPVAAGSVVIPLFADATLYTDNDSHSHGVNGTTGGASSTTHNHAVNPPAQASTAAATGDVLPYVQLLVCRRD